MSENEQLGINIQLTTGDAINNIAKLMEQLKNINEAVSKIGSGSNGFSGLGDESEKSSKRINVVASALNLTVERVKQLQTLVKDLSLAKPIQAMDEATKGVTGRVEGLQAVISSINAKRSTVNPFADMLKDMPALGSSLAQIEKAIGLTSSEIKALTPDKIRQLTSALHPFKVGIDAATGALKSMRSTNTFSFLAGSLGSVFTRLTEFYSIRSVLFSVSGQLRESVTTLLDFNQTLHDTLAITGGAPSTFKGLEQAALSMAKHTRFSATEVAHAMQTLAQAGVSNSDLPEATQVATMLATGTGATIEQASKVLTTGMNVWKIDAKDSIHIANVLTGALNASKLEIGELGTAFNYLANQSALMGQSMTQTVSIIGVMRNQGVEASTIGTSMSQMMKALEAPTPRFQKLLKAYQIDPESVRPTQHTMIEIVKVFEEAAHKLGNNSIAIGDLFRGLETRVGRGFATLIQAGSQALVEMEDQIKNTNAVAVAWAEHMKGARAQINILKAELVETVSALSINSSVFLSFAETIRNFLVGLRGGAGDIALFTAGVAALSAALWYLCSVPVVGVLTGIAAVMGSIITKAGEADRELAAGFDKLNNSIANSSRDFKNATEELNGLNRSIKENKRDSAGNIVVGEQYRQVLYDLIKAHPELANKLGDEATLQAAITTELKKQNTERREKLRLEMMEFNSLSSRVSDENKEYRDKFKRITGRDLPQGATVSKIEEEVEKAKSESGFFKRQEIRAELRTNRLKESNASYNQSIQLMKGSPNVVFDTDPVTGVKTARIDPTVENIVNKQVKNSDKNLTPKDDKDAKKAQHAEESMDHKLADVMNSLVASIEDDTVKKVENDINLIKDKMAKAAKSGDAATYDAASEDYTEALNTGIDEQLTKWDIHFKTSLAKKIGATYNASDNTFEFPDTVSGNQNRNNWKQYWTADRQALYQKAYSSKDSRFTSDANKKIDESPDFEFKAKITDSLRSEKEADRALTLAKAGLAIRKEEARTAEELHSIELSILDAEEKATRAKLKGYNTEVGERQARLDDIRANYTKDEIANNQKLTDEVKLHVDKLEEVNEKLANANKLLELQKVKRADLSNEGVGYNLTKGAAKGLSSYGTTETQLQGLGENLTKTSINGITDSLNNMVTALGKGKNAWASFTSGLKNMTVSILEMIQKQIMQMMVLYMVKKMVGLIGGWIGGGDSASSESAGSTMNVNSSGIPVSFGAAQQLKFAEGGLVPLNAGIAGKDSVRAWLMPGEYVVPRDVVARYGVDYFESMRTQKFAEGGLVGSSSASKANNQAKDANFSLNIINVADPSSIPKTSGQDILNVMSFEANRKGPVFKQWQAKMAGN